MKILFLIIKKEIRIAIREKLVGSLGLIILALLGVALYAGLSAYNQQQTAIAIAGKEKREEWLGQGDKHPHIAAHYGTFIFKPKTVLSLFDFGLDTFTGTSVYLEAHYQHEFMFRPAQDHSSMIRFGELSAALVLQILVPLLIIFLAFSSFTSEKERGTLKLLSSQGISFAALAWGKILAFMIILFSILLPFFAAGFILSGQAANSASIPDVGIRIIFLVILFALYLLVFVTLCVFVSLNSSKGRNALLTLLTCWILFTIIVPKTAANFGESFYPLPSMKAYKEAIQKGIKEGPDGKTPRSVRMAGHKKEYLEKYKVDSVQQLPMNFEGVSMQAGEDYGNSVYDIHRNRLLDIFRQQNLLGSFASLINPYLAVRNISMGLAGTDFYTSIDFQQKAEAYRRDFVRKMNHDMAQNSKYGEFYEYKAGRNLWEEVKDFQYQAPSARDILLQYKIELAALLSWMIVLTALISYSSKKAKPIHG